MTGSDKARHLFQEAGLAFPTIPEQLAARLKEHGKWLFSTRELKMSPYNLQHYVDEGDDAPREYAIVSHSGHGVNSYAIQYYFVSGPLRMFLHLGWGGVYMDAEATTSKIRQCFSLADEIVPAAMTRGKLSAGDQLMIVGSDFYGSYWSAPGQSQQKEKTDSKGPAEVLTEALHWLKSWSFGGTTAQPVRGPTFMSANPWLRLPAQPPFVLPEHEQAVHEFNAGASEDHRLQITDFLPEPFIGDPASPVLLLSNNPGFSKHSAYRTQPEFMTRIRDCISLKMSNCPFFYLAPDYRSRWWRQKLKCLLQKFGDDVVARSVCNVVFFPYVSKKFGHGHCKLPSQEFSFRLVREAMERGAVIVLMRKGQLKHWKNNVPRLGDYDKLILLRNPQMPAVSPKNCNVGDYEKVVAAIAAAEMKLRKATTDGYSPVAAAEPINGLKSH